MLRKVKAFHGNIRDVKDLKKKWNLRVSAKARVDNIRREVRKTGGGANEAREVDEDMLIVSADKDITATEWVSQMLRTTPAFSRISGSVDLFEEP